MANNKPHVLILRPSNACLRTPHVAYIQLILPFQCYIDIEVIVRSLVAAGPGCSKDAWIMLYSG